MVDSLVHFSTICMCVGLGTVCGLHIYGSATSPDDRVTRVRNICIVHVPCSSIIYIYKGQSYNISSRFAHVRRSHTLDTYLGETAVGHKRYRAFKQSSHKETPRTPYDSASNDASQTKYI